MEVAGEQSAAEPDQKVWVPFGKHKNRVAEFDCHSRLNRAARRVRSCCLSRLLQTLEVGGLAVIDEFENDLHPHMLEPILDLFANPSTNPHQAQLLFTCHAVEVLNLVHKSQVMLVQKERGVREFGQRLDAVEGIRNDDNFYAKYMAGAYGAVPRF